MGRDSNAESEGEEKINNTIDVSKAIRGQAIL